LRGKCDEAKEWDLENLILPVGMVGGEGGKLKPGCGVCNRCLRVDQENARAKCSRFKVSLKVPRKHVDIVRYQNSILIGGIVQEIAVGHTFNARFGCAEKIYGFASTPASRKQMMVQAGVGEQS
jgi:hypothetical protein